MLTDVDECNGTPCNNNGVCSNTVGSFTCDCGGTGYSGNICQTGNYLDNIILQNLLQNLNIVHIMSTL